MTVEFIETFSVKTSGLPLLIQAGQSFRLLAVSHVPENENLILLRILTGYGAEKEFSINKHFVQIRL